MASSDGTDLVALVAAEVAKQLPVKQATEPAAVQIGQLGADVVKCIRLALAPIRWVASEWDRLEEFIGRAAGRVPDERRVEPAPQILGPILEGIRYEPSGSISDEAFSELLSRAFDRERASQAHPAFPNIIRTLAEDEIRIVRALARLEPRPFPPGDIPVPELPLSALGLDRSESIPIYIGHLGSLGLTVQPFGWDPSNFAVMVGTVRTYMLSTWGLALAAAIETTSPVPPSAANKP